VHIKIIKNLIICWDLLAVQKVGRSDKKFTKRVLLCLSLIIPFTFVLPLCNFPRCLRVNYDIYCIERAESSGDTFQGWDIASSNPAGGMDVCRVVCCQVEISASG
jgi:hypothetical protein